MDRVRHGDTILMHKNAGYRLKAETEGKHAREVLIPQQDGYKAGQSITIFNRFPC